MLRIGASSHGESRLRMLRVVRRGDRHDRAQPDGVVPVRRRLRGGVRRRPVGRAASREKRSRAWCTPRRASTRSREIERFGLVLCDRLLAGYPRDHARARRDRRAAMESSRSRRQGAGTGVPARHVRSAAPPPITSNGKQVAVVSGIEQLTLMRTSGLVPAPTGEPARRGRRDGVEDGLPRLLVATLSARWTYTSAGSDVRPLSSGRAPRDRRNLRAVTRADRSSTPSMRSRTCVLASYRRSSDISLTLQERPYRPADLFRAGVENPDELFVAVEEPVGVVEVTVDRDSR